MMMGEETSMFQTVTIVSKRCTLLELPELAA
jgi:hypothetical protein